MTWADWLCTETLKYVEKVTDDVGKDGATQPVARYVLSSDCPSDLRDVLSHVVAAAPPDSVDVVLAPGTDVNTSKMFRRYLDHEKRPWAVALCSLVEASFHSSGQATAAWRSLREHHPKQAIDLLPMCPSRERVSEGMRDAGVDNVFNHGDQHPLQDMSTSKPGVYALVRAEAAGCAGLDAEVIDWWCVDSPADVPPLVVEELATAAMHVLQPHYLDWYDQCHAIREWAREWWSEQPDDDVDREFRHLKGDAYATKLRRAAEKRSTQRERVVQDGQDGVKRYWQMVVTDARGIDHVVHEKAFEPGEDGPVRRSVPIDPEAVRAVSVAALRGMPSHATTAFYQLHDLVLIPGTVVLGELKLLNLISKYGARGVLRRTKGTVLKKGVLEFWGGHDEVKLVAALKQMTTKDVQPGGGGEPEVTYGY
ncbi:hypothetical protein [Lentzea sp. NEAU-D7]|uniref:hypothetical protein n=1 Tax=Lentzea sp. NEAU-D7 TaxID=2994667 RepID=UPI00224A5C9A|nr:hypothetical protein [Lentzea sp. NEAU-D7]MCX2948409.1 hypothetical protein [Lentzea sp. NEAU-D7]